ncbi:hypothetical protein CVS40_3980 [Lucilia cuprina]|nr:hypothetical protein CVS40_3980 [Lucilia cuprina]
MLEENNNGHISNGHLPNSKVPTTTTTTTTSAEADMAQSTLLTKFMTWIDPFVDFSWFIICSIGFIFQSHSHSSVGYLLFRQQHRTYPQILTIQWIPKKPHPTDQPRQSPAGNWPPIVPDYAVL